MTRLLCISMYLLQKSLKIVLKKVLDGLEEGLKVALKSLRMVLNDIDDG